MFGKIISFLQGIIASDTTALTAAAVAIIANFALSLGLHLDKTQTVWLTSTIVALLGALVHTHFNAKKS